MARGEVAEKRGVAAWSTRWRPHLLRISLLITQRGEARQSGLWRGDRRVTPLRAGLGRRDGTRGLDAPTRSERLEEPREVAPPTDGPKQWKRGEAGNEQPRAIGGQASRGARVDRGKPRDDQLWQPPHVRQGVCTAGRRRPPGKAPLRVMRAGAVHNTSMTRHGRLPHLHKGRENRRGWKARERKGSVGH